MLRRTWFWCFILFLAGVLVGWAWISWLRFDGVFQ